MVSLINMSYRKESMSQIKDWNYGENWPVVYIVYNHQKAYVGETLDAVRRTEQHFGEKEFDEFEEICFISGMTFNKSVALDLESFLIKYMSADNLRKLTNGNAGVVDHDYFYREAYEDEFRQIWKLLIDRGLADKSLTDIENSELYKYSPYKSLNHEQKSAAYEILKRLCEIDNAYGQSLIIVSGGAGTGKTILAVYLLKLLNDINNARKVWNTMDELEDALFVKKLSDRATGLKKIGLVVPMVELRKTMKKIFSSIDGLSEKMVIAPSEAVGSMYDLLIVDEAHRLYRRKHLPGRQLYLKFDDINKKIMTEGFTGTEDDLTELDWIIKSSRTQVLFYDSMQAIRTADIGKKRFEDICRPYLYKYIELFSQMRCRGGNGYYEYVRKVLTGESLDRSDYRIIKDYELMTVRSARELFDAVRKKNIEYGGLCKVVTGPGWALQEDITIDTDTYHWSGRKKDEGDVADDVIFSIHKTQGFDLNFAGVIIGRELYYDEHSRRIEVDRDNLKDNFVKSNGANAMREYVLNIYLTLLTRGIYGTFVYALDPALQRYISEFFV